MPKLKKIRIREVSLCRKGQNPEANIVLHKADIREPITGPLVLSPEEKAKANAWAEQFLESQKIQKESDMTDNATKDYATLCKAYSEKWDVTPEAAGARLIRDRPDLVAQAYDAEQAAYVQRQVGKRRHVYGS